MASAKVAIATQPAAPLISQIERVHWVFQSIGTSWPPERTDRWTAWHAAIASLARWPSSLGSILPLWTLRAMSSISCWKAATSSASGN
jgi:hypothetical protein